MDDDNDDNDDVEEVMSAPTSDANITTAEPKVVSMYNVTSRNTTSAWLRRARPNWIAAAVDNKNNNPFALWQAAVDRYWEEFRIGNGGISDATATTTAMDPRRPPKQQQQLPLAIQLQNLLVALSNAADEGGSQYNLPPMTVLEAWKESLGYTTNSDESNTSTQKGPTSVSIYDPSNRTNVEAWKESWNRGMTNDSVRDVGNHVWRYLLGGEYEYRQVHDDRYSCKHI